MNCTKYIVPAYRVSIEELRCKNVCAITGRIIPLCIRYKTINIPPGLSQGFDIKNAPGVFGAFGRKGVALTVVKDYDVFARSGKSFA